MNYFGWSSACTSVGLLLFGVFYRPPNQGVNNLVALIVYFQYRVILRGDLNLPIINWSLTFPMVSSPTANVMCDLVHDNYLNQMVVDPIHVNIIQST